MRTQESVLSHNSDGSLKLGESEMPASLQVVLGTKEVKMLGKSLYILQKNITQGWTPPEIMFYELVQKNNDKKCAYKRGQNDVEI